MYMIYLVLAVLILHVISLPLIISVVADVDSDADTARLCLKLFFIPIFVKKTNVEGVLDRVIEKTNDGHSQHEQNDKKSKSNGLAKKFLTAFAWSMVRRIRVRDIELDAKLGLGDAAASACTVGTLQILTEQIKAFFGYAGGQTNISPDYETECIFFDFFGIISICFGDIIYAVCAAILNVISNRTRQRRYYANTVTE